MSVKFVFCQFRLTVQAVNQNNQKYNNISNFCKSGITLSMSGSKDGMEMEVEPSSSAEKSVPAETPKSVMAQGAVGSVTCSLHPLVIMNVSEHWTRERAQEGAVKQGN